MIKESVRNKMVGSVVSALFLSGTCGYGALVCYKRQCWAELLGNVVVALLLCGALQFLGTAQNSS